MRKQAGFTLIELVIVIVILGILGAVAAPKFMNLQGDAYGANLDSLKNSMESASTLANTKSILGGFDEGTQADQTVNGATVDFEDGYPAAKKVEGILALLDIDAATTASASASTQYVYDDTTTSGTIVLNPKARDGDANCQVSYTEPASAGARPAIVIDTTGC
jgi:MSHA pilin protein MshA